MQQSVAGHQICAGSARSTSHSSGPGEVAPRPHTTFLYLLRLLTPYALPAAKAQAAAVNGTAFEACRGISRLGLDLKAPIEQFQHAVEAYAGAEKGFEIEVTHDTLPF